MDNYTHQTYQHPQVVHQQVAKRKMPSKNFFVTLTFFVLAGTLGIVGYLYYAAVQENQDLKDGSIAGASSEEEGQKVVDALKKLINIDPEEKINIEKVTDIQKFIDQDPEFYKDLQLGQYVVVLPDSLRLMIYDMNENKLMNFSNYTLNVEIVPEEEIAAKEKPLNVEIFYTTKVTQEQIDNVKEALAKLSTNYVITATKQATKDDYKGVQVVVLNTKDKPTMSQNFIGHVGTNKISEKMPEGEQSSIVDAVLILGELPKSVTGEE